MRYMQEKVLNALNQAVFGEGFEILQNPTNSAEGVGYIQEFNEFANVLNFCYRFDESMIGFQFFPGGVEPEMSFGHDHKDCLYNLTIVSLDELKNIKDMLHWVRYKLKNVEREMKEDPDELPAGRRGGLRGLR